MLRILVLALLVVLTLAGGEEATLLTEVQGIAFVQARDSRRWRPADEGLALHAGDRLRCAARGANAVRLRLPGGATAVAGPGALVETGDGLRLLAGELAVEQAGGLKVCGPEGPAVTPATAVVLRVDGPALVPLALVPQWFDGFRGAAPAERMGELLAQVDGRAVPLSISRYRVEVDIRDQVCRTVVDESFRNHTGADTEGVFRFPLPADAAVTGFAMWIGDELVEADVVEKQRAREIYDTIRRRQRDPALLEWSGGNLFTARVFPIPAGGEKRIRLTWLQALPQRDGVVRYRHALRSEQLRAHPLTELRVTVRLDSASGLASVLCPSHPAARIRQAGNSAELHLEERDCRPAADLAVDITLPPKTPPLRVLAHRRGDDGYLLALVTPPPVPPPTGPPTPRDLILIADTSASIDADARARQAMVISTLLACLGPDDRVRLACADHEVRWFDLTAQTPSPDLAKAAGAWLDAQVSLGWTDLDRVAAAVRAMARPGTHTVYLGDGIPTAGDADAAALADRLRRGHLPAHGTFHAVALGAGCDLGVLTAWAACGGGRLLDADDPATARRAAADLLDALDGPAMTDLTLDFEGLDTAARHPGRLPAMASGRQMLVTARYAPGIAATTGTAVLNGRSQGRPFTWKVRFDLPAADAGNDFIPRLWARQRLDDLLAQGRAPAIESEIIALSERFGMVTPYTSLLVLESDADRRAFGVRRRLQERGGEAFFADAATRTRAALAPQAARQAHTWVADLAEVARERLARIPRPRHYAPIPDADLVVTADPRLGVIRGTGAMGKAYGGFMAVGCGGGSRSAFGRTARPAASPSSLIGPELIDCAPPSATDRQNGLFLPARPRGRPVEEDGEDAWRTWQDGRRHPEPSVLRRLLPQMPNPPAPIRNDWPAEAVAVWDALVAQTRPALAGLRVEIREEVPPDRQSTRILHLAGDASWSAHEDIDGHQRLAWCHDGRIGAGDLSTGLGVQRPQRDGDSLVDLDLAWLGLPALAACRSRACAGLERDDQGRLRLRLVSPYTPTREDVLVFAADSRRLAAIEQRADGVCWSSQHFLRPIALAGAPFPSLIEHHDAQGRVTRRQHLRCTILTAEALAQARREHETRRQDLRLLDGPLPSAPVADRAWAKDGTRCSDAVAWVRLEGLVGRGQREGIDEMGGLLLRRWQGSLAVERLGPMLAACRRDGDELHRLLMAAASRRPDESLRRHLSRCAGLLDLAKDLCGSDDRSAFLSAVLPSADAVAAEPACAEVWASLVQQQAILLSTRGEVDAAFALVESGLAALPALTLLHQTRMLLLQAQGDADGLLAAEKDWQERFPDLPLSCALDDLLREQGRHAELAARCRHRLAVLPASRWQEARQLTTTLLEALDRSGQTEALMAELAELAAARPATPEERVQLDHRRAGAAQALFGVSWQTRHVQQVAPQTLAWALTLARSELEHLDEAPLLAHLASHPLLQRDPAVRSLVVEAADRLEARRGLDGPALVQALGRLDGLLRLLPEARVTALRETWRQALRNETDLNRRLALAEAIGQLPIEDPNRFLAESLADEVLALTPPPQRGGLLHRECENLRQRPWSERREARAFALLAESLTHRPDRDAHDAQQRTQRAENTLLHLVDWALKGRLDSLADAWSGQAAVDRQSLLRHLAEGRCAAHRDLAARVLALAESQPRLAGLGRSEAEDLLARINEGRAASGRRLLALLADRTPPPAEAHDQAPERRLWQQLAGAAALGDDATLRRDVLALFARHDHPVLRRLSADILAATRDWDALARQATAWQAAHADEPFWPWLLALLDARRGDLPQALGRLDEAVLDALAVPDLRLVQTWRLARGETALAEDCARRIDAVGNVWELRAAIDQLLEALRTNRAAPGAGTRIVELLRVLLREDAAPQHHLSLVKQALAARCDRQVLTPLVEALGGGSVQTLEFLCQSQDVLDGLRDEAVADALTQAVARRLTAAPSAEEARALNLLDTACAWRIAEISDQGQVHRDRAAALDATEATPTPDRLALPYLRFLARLPPSRHATLGERHRTLALRHLG